ncbi:Galectin-3-binding protein A [Fasciola hepatica]|uniref:Galectin-3-binding protein A n=1 Tax=Fasciola hepatica TaxID=6192 RepID=A0A4E0RED7_FASHE|nr:Galectin-3-binding protein A [Fasciola hepatica]
MMGLYVSIHGDRFDYNLYFSTPRGVSIFNSVRKSNLKPILSNFNCTGKVVLSSMNPNTATVHLGVCSFTKEIPIDCTAAERQAAILCIDPIPIRTTTTPEPNYMTLSPVDCSNPSASNIRLVGGTENSGRVEIRHPESNEWGTICADGFDSNSARTVCRMLCTSADNLQLAYPILYSFGAADDSMPIHLARISCPAYATDLNGCHLGGGWGSVTGCTHAMDVGVQCGPVAHSTKSPLYSPELLCNHTHATVRYVKSENRDLTPSMISLFGDVPLGCQLRVAETDQYIEAYVPLDGCGGSLSLSNESTIAIRLELIRHYMAPEDGIISQLPVRFGVTCLIPRGYRIQSDPLVAPELIADLLGGTSGVAASLKMYRDPHFQQPLGKPFAIRPGETVHALVSLSHVQNSSKLILENCWATTQPDRNSLPRENLIVNRCAVYDNLTVVPLSANEVGFTFRAFYLGQAGAVVPVPTNLYLHCDTRVCHVNEIATSCNQFCRTPIVRDSNSVSRRRLKRKLTDAQYAKEIRITEGPVLVQNN